jgi:hypothetical protein
MQHNTLNGKINKNYNRNLDTTTHHHKPLKATIPTTAKVAKTTKNSTISDNDSSVLIDLHNESYHPIQDLPDNQDSYESKPEYYHIIPSPTANAGLALSKQEDHQQDLFEDTSDLLFETNYLHFTS